jgi:hypothetical protein
MQTFGEHTKGGLPPGLGMHGAPLQQSALDAHDAPALKQTASAQRGTPRLSCLQVSCVSQLPAQQSHDELHDMFCSLQTSPLGLHPMGRRQTPSGPPPLMSQVTGLVEPPGSPVAPQQSPSAVQRSPTGWQPLAGWQMRIPVGPHGAQARLQHGPPQAGRPPSMKVAPPSAAVPPQSCPSTRPQFAGPVGAEGAQTPIVLPVATVQEPVQQSVPVAQASPGCAQKEEGWHVPDEQKPEQQEAPDEQALPTVEQLPLSGVHVPFVPHVWLQHWPFDVHAPLSDWQLG